MLPMVFKIISNSLNSRDWVERFNGVNMLRSLNKSFPEETYSIFEGFGREIMECLNSSKSSLVKNCLAFVYELLLQSSSLHPQIFEKVLPVVLRMTQHTSESFRNCCSQCISLVYQRHPNSTTMSVFAIESVSNSNKPGLSKLCFKAMIKCIHTLKSKISELEPGAFQIVFRTISFHLNNFKSLTRGSAERLCRYFFEMMGDDNFKEYVKTLVDENVISLISANQLINVAMSLHRKPNAQRFEFKNFKSKNGQMMKINKMRNFTQGIPNEFFFDSNVHQY